MKHLLIAVLLIACVPDYTRSQKDTPKRITVNGFLKGQDYLDMNEAGKRAYAMGVIDGMLAAQMLDAPEEKVTWLNACIKNMNDEQIAAIFTKHIRDNPSQWHYRMNILSFNAMVDACPRPAKP
jgi:hypothetical protein